jgi:hypothetical protein
MPGWGPGHTAYQGDKAGTTQPGIGYSMLYVDLIRTAQYPSCI